MNKRLLWIGVILGLAACGDDEASPSSSLNSSSTNSSVNGSSNTTTNNSENNGPDADAGSDTGVADADPSLDDASNNNSVNNSVNNSSSTNNSTNISAGVTCMEILQCLLVCNTEDKICQQDCKDTGSPAAHRKIDAYLGCVDTVCADATGVTELTECVLDKCSVEQAACLE